MTGCGGRVGPGRVFEGGGVTQPSPVRWSEAAAGLAALSGAYRPSSKWARGVAAGNVSVMPELM